MRGPKKAVALGVVLTFCLTLFYVCIWQLDVVIFGHMGPALPPNYFLTCKIWIPIPPWKPMKIPIHDAICYFMYGMWFSLLVFGGSMFLIGYYWSEETTKQLKKIVKKVWRES